MSADCAVNLTPGYQHYVAVFVTVSVKTMSVPAVPYVVAWACSAAVVRQAQEARRRVSRAKEWAELQASWLRALGQNGKIELDPI